MIMANEGASRRRRWCFLSQENINWKVSEHRGVHTFSILFKSTQPSRVKRNFNRAIKLYDLAEASLSFPNVFGRCMDWISEENGIVIHVSRIVTLRLPLVDFIAAQGQKGLNNFHISQLPVKTIKWHHSSDSLQETCFEWRKTPRIWNSNKQLNKDRV